MKFQPALIKSNAFLPFMMFSLHNAGLAEEHVDHKLFAKLLEKYVIAGQVDYAAFKSEETVLDRYLDALAAVKPDVLAEDQQFAFYINAYNAWTIKLILTGYPGVKSIKDLGTLFQSPWKKKIARLNGGLVSLDYIEHDILRPRFKDPRVHFVINCAALSCPPLASVPFSGEILSRQLDDATRMFINNPERNYIDGRALYVSKIFKWFPEDFNYDIITFFEKYADGALKEGLRENRGNIKVKYLHYDWSLNGK